MTKRREHYALTRGSLKLILGTELPNRKQHAIIFEDTSKAESRVLGYISDIKAFDRAVKKIMGGKQQLK